MSRAENLLEYAHRPPGWVVVEHTKAGLVLRDPELSLWGAVTSGWRLLLTAGANLGLTAFCIVIAPPIIPFQVIACLALVLTVFCFHCIWQRWRSPSRVLIGNGRIFVQNQKGATVIQKDWDVREVIEVETSHNSSTFHSQYSVRIHLGDGEK